MRQMDGECHRQNRRALVQGINAIDFPALAPNIHSIVLAGLAAYAVDGPLQSDRGAWSDTLSSISSDLLIHSIFGVQPGTAAFEELKAGYFCLGPHDVAWTITVRQAEAFGDLTRQLNQLLSGDKTLDPATSSGFHSRCNEKGASLITRPSLLTCQINPQLR